MPRNRTDNDASWGETTRQMERANQLLAEMELQQQRTFAALSRGTAAAAADVDRLNRAIERGTTQALAGLLTDSRKTSQALEQVWGNFMDFFASRVVRGMKGALSGLIPSPGGLLGSLVGGVLGLFGLQSGGLVRGSRNGTPVMLGENFTDELVVPLSKLGLNAAALPSAGQMAPPPSPAVTLYPQFVIENRMPIEADLAIYQLAERGRLRVAARTLTAPVSPAKEG